MFARALLGLVALAALPAAAQDVTLKVQHFLPPASPAQAQFIKPWADAIAAESNGRIKVEIFAAMALGGRPPQLYDQVKDGVADVVWTLPGYTAGRFPKSEVFELPFMAASAEVTAQATQEFYEKHLRDEFKDVHVLVMHAHAPGSIFMVSKPVMSVDDLKGMKVRAPTRVMNEALKALGATPVGMPVPELPQALSRGVVDGATIPFEVALPLKAHEMVKHVTEIPGSRGFYTSVFLYAMNKAKYDGLPADLKKVIDNNSGMALAKKVGKIWDDVEKPGRDAAMAAKVAFHTMPAAEVTKMQAATRPVIDAWIKEMDGKGANGKMLVDDARAMIAKYSK
jgi:TRAP-type C4-dicarboxylate transport system substrate-binding protein